MADKEVLEQYGNMGENYIRNQRIFFTDKEDWTRMKLREVFHGVSGGNVLDVGCGAGDDIKWCEENGIEAYGIDPSEKMISFAKETVNSKDRILLGDFEHIPFADETFDLIIGRYSLHYLREFSKAYLEMYRVLKLGGQIVLIVSHPTFDAWTVARTKGKMVSVKLYDGKVTVEFPPHTISDYFSQTFLELFDLLEVAESISVDAENPEKIPETLFYRAAKKTA